MRRAEDDRFGVLRSQALKLRHGLLIQVVRPYPPSVLRPATGSAATVRHPQNLVQRRQRHRLVRVLSRQLAAVLRELRQLLGEDQPISDSVLANVCIVLAIAALTNVVLGTNIHQLLFRLQPQRLDGLVVAFE